MNSQAVNEDGEYIPFKTPYNYDHEKECARTALYCRDPSKTQQHGKDEADINVIVDRFLKTGTLPAVPMPPSYENFGDIFDFQSAMDTLKAATDSFNALPANVRSRFDNDPAKFVAYVDHCVEREDLEPLEKMGLALPKKAQEPPKDLGPPPEPKTPEPKKEPPSGSKT